MKTNFLVLANMLMKSGINPFDSQEAKPYKNDVEILAMTNLVTAYQNNDINEFEKILKVSSLSFLPFVFENVACFLGEQANYNGGHFHQRAYRGPVEEH